jgi:molybdopterin converting factor small subunit
MARVRRRSFAAARATTGCAETALDATTVGEALEHARATYGPDLAAVLTTARVWVNGDEPHDGEESVLADGDELAVVPPVSGGSQ